MLVRESGYRVSEGKGVTFYKDGQKGISSTLSARAIPKLSCAMS